MPIATPSSGPLFVGQIRPPDVPAYVPQPIAYATGGAQPTIGDGTATGGFAPYWASQPADIPTPSRSGWLKAGPGQAAFDALLAIGFGGTKGEAKFRTHSEMLGHFSVDPIRNYGFPGGSHMHSFWGNYTPSAVTTRATQRTLIGDDDGSGAAGGRLNNTAYWMPALLFDKGGVTYAISPAFTIIYYKQSPSQSIITHPIPNGLRYVSGFDMDNPTRIENIVAQANADNGGGTRYRVHEGISVNNVDGMWHDWTINNATAGTTKSKYLQNPDTTSPFAANGSAASGATTLQMQFQQRLAWDGVNPWSPRGYDHVMPCIFDNTAGIYVPPIGWYVLPIPEYNMSWDIVEIEAFLGGPFMNFNPRLASDAHANMMGVPGKGMSFHTDWMDGWDETTRRAWETNGIGCGVLGGIPHEMSDSTISATEDMLAFDQVITPDGKARQVDFGRGIQVTQIPATPKAVTVAAMA